MSFLLLLVVGAAVAFAYLRWKDARAKRKCIHGIIEHACDNADIDPELNQFEWNPAAALVHDHVHDHDHVPSTTPTSENVWEEEWNDEHNRPYYVNPLSGETAWARPSATGNEAFVAEPAQESTVYAEEASVELTADAVFDAVDADGNGTISLVEFQQWWNARQEEVGMTGASDVTSQAAVLFAELDTDGSQTLDRAEFVFFIEEMAIGGCSSWKEHKDTASGSTYYVDKEAGKSQWVKPGKAEVKTWLAARLGSSKVLGVREKVREMIMEMDEEMAADACNDLNLTPEDISLAGMQAALVEYHCTPHPVSLDVPPTLPGPPPMLTGPPTRHASPALLHSDGTPHVLGDAHADHSLALPPRGVPRRAPPLTGPLPTLTGPRSGSPRVQVPMTVVTARSALPAYDDARSFVEPDHAEVRNSSKTENTEPAEASEMRELIMMMDKEVAAEACFDLDLTPDDISLAGMQAVLLLHYCGTAGAAKDSSALPVGRVPPTLIAPPMRPAPGGMPEHPGDMSSPLSNHAYPGMLSPPPMLTGPPTRHASPALLHSDGTPHVLGDAHADHSLALPPRGVPRRAPPLTGPLLTLPGPGPPTLTVPPSARAATPASMHSDGTPHVRRDSHADHVSVQNLVPMTVVKVRSGHQLPLQPAHEDTSSFAEPDHAEVRNNSKTDNAEASEMRELIMMMDEEVAAEACFDLDLTPDDISLAGMQAVLLVHYCGTAGAAKDGLSHGNQITQAMETRALIMQMDEEMAAEACFDLDLTPDDISLAGMRAALILHHCGSAGAANETVAGTVAFNTFEMGSSMSI
jgi:hypothetical protein